jgi:DNA polymerase-4
VILHLDMDAFYAAVEQRERPELRGRCLIVGGRGRRAVVTTASYEARRYGVRSAMPMFQALERCPEAIVVAPRMRLYQAVSHHIMSLLGEFSPLVEPVSIDEAYIDATGCQRLFGPPAAMAAAIKARIHAEVCLTCSLGAAPVRFLAKIASEMQKPDGLTVIEPWDVPDVIAALPIRKVPGVGPRTLAILAPLGVRSLGDVSRLPGALLERRLGKFGHRLAALAAGEDPTPVRPGVPAKSVSSEETLASDTADRQMLRRRLLRQAEEVARHLRRIECRARTITLKIKHADFRLANRSATLSRPSQSSADLFHAAENLLQAYVLEPPVRLIGLGASNLVRQGNAIQMELFDAGGDGGDGWIRVDRVLDDISGRFGAKVIQRASLVDDEHS